MSLGATLLRNDLIGWRERCHGGGWPGWPWSPDWHQNVSNTLATVTFHFTQLLLSFFHHPASLPNFQKSCLFRHHFHSKISHAPGKSPKHVDDIAERPELSTNALASFLSLTQLTNAVGQMMKTWATANPWRKIPLNPGWFNGEKWLTAFLSLSPVYTANNFDFGHCSPDFHGLVNLHPHQKNPGLRAKALLRETNRFFKSPSQGLLSGEVGRLVRTTKARRKGQSVFFCRVVVFF